MSIMTHNTPLVLCILDGWGEAPSGAHNAIDQTATPTWDRLWDACPHTLLEASGEAVGLPAGQMGNSEVGHLTLGAGRMVRQDLPRIHHAIATDALKENPTLKDMIQHLQGTKGTAHIMGLLSPGGVHSHMDHMIALVKILRTSGIPIAIHGLLDGRDTPPESALTYVKDFMAALQGYDATLQTLAGRFYTMDRDERWERVEKGYAAMVHGSADTHYTDPFACIESFYKEGITDEFIPPCTHEGYAGFAPGDALLSANFRADRVRQILTALTDDGFTAFNRGGLPEDVRVYGMTPYASWLNEKIPSLFPPQKITHTLGACLSAAGLRQLRAAETEKYAHVTYFFNGGEEPPYPGEERLMIPSPKVKTYDLQPEMAAQELTDNVIEKIRNDQVDVVIMNYANTDMVGHTGNFEAVCKAVETVDHCLGQLAQAVEESGGCLMVTADHGNAECMEKGGAPHTAHTTAPVPFLLTAKGWALKEGGSLADVAPTVLAVLGLPQPEDMKGTSLLVA